MLDRRPDTFWSRWTMTLSVVAVSAAAVTWTRAEENVVRLEAPVWIASTEFKFVTATVRVIAGHPVTLVLDNSQAETEHGINLPAFGFYLIARGGQVTRKTFIFDKPGELLATMDISAHAISLAVRPQWAIRVFPRAGKTDPPSPLRRGLQKSGLGGEKT